jgi:hypothetical protein
MSPMNRRGRRRGIAVRILLVTAFGVLTAGAAVASRPIMFSLSDTQWGASTTSGSVSLD